MCVVFDVTVVIVTVFDGDDALNAVDVAVVLERAILTAFSHVRVNNSCEGLVSFMTAHV